MKEILRNLAIVIGLFLVILFLYSFQKLHSNDYSAYSIQEDIFAINKLTLQNHWQSDSKKTLKNTSKIQTIFEVNDTFTWLREPLLMRLPDGSLFCEIYTGGRGDGHKGNVVAAVRSDDDGKTWSELEIVKALKDTGCWASSVFVDDQTGYIFWYTMDKSRNLMTHANARILCTGADGRNFEHDRRPRGNWDTEQCLDIRRGVRLRNGKILLPVAWKEPANEAESKQLVDADGTLARRWGNFGGKTLLDKISLVGVVEPNADFTEFTRFGRIHHLTPDGALPSVPFFENQIAELSDGSLVMLIRADMTNRLWRSESRNQGRTWTDPVKTDIPNPGSKALVINLPDGRIVLFHNPNEKDLDDSSPEVGRKYRTPLEMWVSDDDMKTWNRKETLVAAPALAQYPDGFYDPDKGCIFLVWEDDRKVYFRRIAI
jgi:hypothetical protein